MAANKYQLCPLIDVIENFVIKMAANNSKLAAKKLILVADKSFICIYLYVSQLNEITNNFICKKWII